MDPNRPDTAASGQPAPGDRLTEEELWSWVDRGGEGLGDYLKRHPEDADRVETMRRQIAALHAAAATPSQIGPFGVLRRLGAGGAGIVYAARRLDRDGAPPVALKVLLEGRDASPRQVAMFEREAKALGALQHPNIACIDEAGRTEDGQHWLAMELVDGQPLDRFVERGLEAGDKLRLFAEICAGVRHAHQHGMVHRDLKPSNILVGADGRPRLVDFGLVRSVLGGEFESLTRTGSVVGTLQFMSPEQARGERGVDARADVYSLGVLLYWLALGRLPHDLRELDLASALRAIASPVRCPRLPKGWPPALRAVIETALEPDSADRYRDAGVLADRVAAVVDGGRAGGSVARWWRRGRRLLLSRVALSVIALGVVVGWTWWSTTRPGDGHPRPNPTELLRDLEGRGFAKISPFEGVRWLGGQPRVLVDGRWLDLRSAAGHEVATIVKLAKATSVRVPWTKRFEEDFYEILTRLEKSEPANPVTLELADPISGRVERRAVEMTKAKRQSTRQAHVRSPFESVRWVGREPEVRLSEAGDWWRLLAIEGHPTRALRKYCVERDPSEWRLMFELFLDYLLADRGTSLADSASVTLCALDDDPADATSSVVKSVAISSAYGERSMAKWRTDSFNVPELQARMHAGAAVFEFVRWDQASLRVRHEGRWWDLVSLAGTSIDDLRRFARERFPATWQTRLRVDLVPLAEWFVDEPLPDRVRFELRASDGAGRSGEVDLSEERYHRKITRIRQEERL